MYRRGEKSFALNEEWWCVCKIKQGERFFAPTQRLDAKYYNNVKLLWGRPARYHPASSKHPDFWMFCGTKQAGEVSTSLLATQYKKCYPPHRGTEKMRQKHELMKIPACFKRAGWHLVARPRNSGRKIFRPYTDVKASFTAQNLDDFRTFQKHIIAYLKG